MKVLRIKHGDDKLVCILPLADTTAILAAVGVAQEESRALLEESSIGDSITLTLDEMSKDKLDSLNEFQGW